MTRLARALFVVLVALAAVLGVAPARAQELGGAPASEQLKTTPLLPRDTPVLVSASQVTIPPVPSSYKTRDLGWLSLSYPPSAEERVAPIVAEAEEFKTLLVERLGQPV
ncbi:MAG TPA: hypothetical protein VIF62_37585, partial [Labilithrix sp.]